MRRVLPISLNSPLSLITTPKSLPKSTEVLQEGNIITIEPGIYIEGNFGVRIEDMLYVTEDGAENLVRLSKELIILP